MKMIIHHLKKELTVSRNLIVLLVLVQLVRLAILLGWTGSPAGPLGRALPTPSTLEALVIYGSFGFLSTLVGQVLLADSPFHRGGFLATRPIHRWQVVVAKVLTVLLAVVAPVLVVEWIHLVAVGMSAVEVLVGVAQAGLSLGAIMLGLMAFSWMWESKREVVTAAVGSVLLVIGTIALGHWLMHSQWGHRPGGQVGQLFEEAFAARRILLGGCLVVGVWWLALLGFDRSKRATFGRRFGLVGVSLMALCLGLWFWPRKPAPVNEGGSVEFAIATASFGEDQAGRKFRALTVEPGYATMPALNTEAWEFERLIWNGQEIEVPRRSNPRKSPENWVSWGSSRFLASADLREKVDGNVAVLARQLGHGSVPQANLYLPEVVSQQAGDEILVALRRHQFHWQQVAEVALERGARSGEWVLEDWDVLGQPERGRRLGRLRLSLSVQQKNLWLAGAVDRNKPGITRALLIDDAEGVCVPAENVRRTSTIGSLTGAPLSGLRVEFHGDAAGLLPTDLKGCRVLLFEAEWDSSSRFEWGGMVTWKELVAHRGLAKDTKDGSLEELDQWLAEHPSPEGGERGLARHLVSILERVNHLPKRLPDGHEAERRLTAMVADHLALLIRAHGELAADQHHARRLLERVIAHGMSEKDLVKNLGELIGMSEVRNVAWKRGWFDGLSDELASGARAGNVTMFLQAVRLPERAGLSMDECLYLFRRSPRKRPSRNLQEIEELRPRLNEAVDGWLAATLRQASPFSGSVDPALEVALERGHSEAPKMLQKLLQHAVHDQADSSHFQRIWHQHFVRMEEGVDPTNWSKWFLALDPDGFVFDEEERKYRWQTVKPKQQQ